MFCFPGSRHSPGPVSYTHLILLRHKVKELDALKACSRVLFVDTDALTTRFYSRFLLCEEEEIRQCEALADAITALNSYDLILFLEPTVEFVQDLSLIHI